MDCGAVLIPQKDPLLLDAVYCDERRLLFACLEACNQLVQGMLLFTAPHTHAFSSRC